MFFPALRKQAKWVFVLLALVFGVGFIFFGVGGNLPGTSIGDILSDSSGTGGGPSESSLRNRIEENPNDAAAYKELATKLQQDGDTEEAITVLVNYSEIAPKDTDALAQLGSLYLAKANRLRARAAQAQADFESVNPGAFLPSLTSSSGQPVITNPIIDQAAQEASQRFDRAYADMQGASQQAVDTYKKIAQATPNDPQAQLQLAQTAQTAADYETAVAAYKKFLRLSPDDQNAPFVRQQVKQLEAQLKQTQAAQAAQSAQPAAS
jgi:tetratricopeptide (TPR) repeat protein